MATAEIEFRESNFDFLDRHQKSKNFCTTILVLKLVAALFAIILFILLVVDLSKKDTEEVIIKKYNEEIYCFYATGWISRGSTEGQSQITSEECEPVYDDYISKDGRYWKDIENAVDAAISEFKSKESNYSQMAVFDIDETSISNIEFLTQNGYGRIDGFEDWALKSAGEVIEPTLEFYKILRENGFAVAFVTGRREKLREATELNLKNVGYGPKCEKEHPSDGEYCYYNLTMRPDDDVRDAAQYKSEAKKVLGELSFEIIASIGDQWSDLLATNNNTQTYLYKMPNPFYYAP